jgi:hypothetical protein
MTSDERGVPTTRQRLLMKPDQTKHHASRGKRDLNRREIGSPGGAIEMQPVHAARLRLKITSESASRGDTLRSPRFGRTGSVRTARGAASVKRRNGWAGRYCAR